MVHCFVHNHKYRNQLSWFACTSTCFHNPQSIHSDVCVLRNTFFSHSHSRNVFITQLPWIRHRFVMQLKPMKKWIGTGRKKREHLIASDYWEIFCHLWALTNDVLSSLIDHWIGCEALRTHPMWMCRWIQNVVKLSFVNLSHTRLLSVFHAYPLHVRAWISHWIFGWAALCAIATSICI